ncbi:hypothetical protein [Sandarakinorhabdus oryzae]|uniref:hypothetical protein n=1 Tax=Sandarakinorhabdus oryzae TaxID=2675220 RepID=UPI0012E1BB0B|nr:hypothetical protein [Sandarakinorhabdus oryzae]
MIGRRKQTFFAMYELLRAIEADREDLTRVRQLNMLLLKEILRSERNIARHKSAIKTLRAQLKTARGSREDANQVRRAISRTERYVEGYYQQRYIWKCFGDGLAYIYLDKYAAKHSFYGTDTYDVKPSAGMLSGKDGLVNEVACLFSALDHRVPSVLCDVTNTLRYGDVCLLGASDPYPIEVKSRLGLNQRGRRQATALKRLTDFLEADESVNFRTPGVTRRVEITVKEHNYRDAMNACIADAASNGLAFVQPEEGLVYIATYTDVPPEAFVSMQAGGPWVMVMLNDDKTAGTWAPYEPFTLSIRDSRHLLDFIEGRLILIVAFDGGKLAESMKRPGWDARFDGDAKAAIQVHHQPTGALFGVSRQFVNRIAFEFVAPSWVVESQTLAIDELRQATARLKASELPPGASPEALRLEHFGKGADIWPETPQQTE